MTAGKNVSVLSDEYGLTIPEGVRAQRGWRPGQEFAFIPKGKGLLIVPVPDLDSLHGIAAGADTTGYRERGDADP